MPDIHTLLSQIFLISGELKEDIIQSIEKLSEGEREKLSQILSEALRMQNQFLAQAIKRNPRLGRELETLYHRGLEESETNQDTSSQILQDLYNLIS